MTKAYHHNMRGKNPKWPLCHSSDICISEHIAINDYVSQFMGTKMQLMYNFHLYLGSRACTSPKSKMATKITYLNS